MSLLSSVVLVLLVAAAASGTVGCAAGSSPPSQSNQVSNNTAFAFDLYQREKSGGGNLFYSPYSISAALAMTYAGARGTTESDIAHALHFPLPSSSLPASFAELAKQFDAIAARKQVELSVANSLWCGRGVHFLEDFLAINRTDYRAEIRELDFVGAPEASRVEINTWVERKTQDKIRDLLKPGQITPDTRLVLCNAVYFKGHWATQFDPKSTVPQPFLLPAGRSNQVPMMSRKLSLKWCPLDGFNLMELPYQGNDLSMLILLPDVIDGLPAIESRLNAASWMEWTSALARRPEGEAVVELPRFKLDCRLELARELSELGMRSAFGPEADFSGMTGKRNLFISAVVHQAFVEVNEEGTEAAAATGVVMMRSAIIRPTVLRMDHPFLFFIVERQTGTVLFLGRLADPSG